MAQGARRCSANKSMIGAGAAGLAAGNRLTQRLDRPEIILLDRRLDLL